MKFLHFCLGCQELFFVEKYGRGICGKCLREMIYKAKYACGCYWRGLDGKRSICKRCMPPYMWKVLKRQDKIEVEERKAKKIKAKKTAQKEKTSPKHNTRRAGHNAESIIVDDMPSRLSKADSKRLRKEVNKMLKKMKEKK